MRDTQLLADLLDVLLLKGERITGDVAGWRIAIGPVAGRHILRLFAGAAGGAKRQAGNALLIYA